MELQQVEVVKDLSPEVFYQAYVKTRTPVKILNYTEGWPANNKWTYAYLKSVAGHHPVKLHGAWQVNEPTRIEMPPVTETSFGAYLDLLESNAPSDLRIFLFNLFKLEPSLLGDFDFPNLMGRYLQEHPYLFFGCAGSDVRLHYDIDLSNVFLSQFGGRKQITLFSQDQSKYLYKLPFTTHSAVDLRNIDFQRYPALKLAKGWRTELLPYETLFMPSGIWHHIKYVDSSFSLSLRTLNPSRMGQIQGAYNVFVIRKLDEYFNKFYKNTWSDFKLRRAIERTNEILKSQEVDRNI